jgi:hypothetical protein
MGKLTVDLKHKKLFVTMDKFNAKFYQDVKQGPNHIRPRPEDNERFSAAFNDPTERDGGGAGYAASNFLGKAWAKKKGFKLNMFGVYTDYPSLNEIFQGLMMEAALEVRKTSGCP